MLTTDDEAWSAFFDQLGIQPLRSTYEELAANPQAILAETSAGLGRDRAIAAILAPQIARMADSTTLQWLKRMGPHSPSPQNRSLQCPQHCRTPYKAFSALELQLRDKRLKGRGRKPFSHRLRPVPAFLLCTNSTRPGKPDDLFLLALVPPACLRASGWSSEVQRAFVGTLARSGSVAAAARSVGRSPRSACKLRERAGDDHPFTRVWDRAQRRATDEALDASMAGGSVARRTEVFCRGRHVG